MRRDLEKYLYSMADQVDKMNKILVDVNKELEEGKVTPEAYENLKTQVDIISGNYQRVLYCKYLLDLRPKFIQWFYNRKQKKEIEKFIKMKADRESVEKENDAALEEMRNTVNGQDD